MEIKKKILETEEKNSTHYVEERYSDLEKWIIQGWPIVLLIALFLQWLGEMK